MVEDGALVVGQAASLREALAALVSGLTGVTKVEQAHSRETAVEMLRKEPAALVVLDASSLGAGKASDIIREVRAASPRTRCAVLTDEVPDWPSMSAPDVLMVLGTPAAELRAIMGRLLA